MRTKMNQNYIYFSEFIYKWLKKKDKKLSKIITGSENNDFYRNYFNENIYNKIKKLFDIHDYIFNSIKDQFTLLNLFLIEDQLISVKCPLEEFILKYSNFILNNWLLSNINMEDFNLSRFLENEDLSTLYKIYFSKKKEGLLFKSIRLPKFI
jgi:F0F1-type ATP synthase gamma subunit